MKTKSKQTTGVLSIQHAGRDLILAALGIAFGLLITNTFAQSTHESNAFNKNGGSFGNNGGPGDPGSGTPVTPEGFETMQVAFEIMSEGKQLKNSCAVCHWLEVKIDGKSYKTGEVATLPKGTAFDITVDDIPKPIPPNAQIPNYSPKVHSGIYTIYPMPVNGQIITAVPGGSNEPPKAFIAKKDEVFQYLIENSEGLLVRDKKWPENESESPVKKKARIAPLEIAVDANRDGVISMQSDPNSSNPIDTSSQERPFRFWVNDDDDFVGTEEIDRVPVVQPDYQDDQIAGRRDLEDFTRLYLYFGAFNQEIANGTLKIGLKWADGSTGTPKIKVFKCAAATGSDSYLKEDTAATTQVSGEFRYSLGEVSGSMPLMVPADVFSGYSDSSAIKCLLFEGSSEGKGQLCITIHKADGTIIGEGPGVWLDLKNIKDMYQRGWGILSSSDHPYSHMDSWSLGVSINAYNNEYAFTPAVDEEKKAVVFVHGIHAPGLDEPDRILKDWYATSETVFKRLWHQGFKGRFVSYKWPALTPAPQIFPPDPAPFAFNESEYRAWKSGQGLAQLLGSLPGDYQKNLYSFSQGAVVCGSALTLYQASVQNYVMSQAAAPAGCYDTTLAVNSYTDFLNAEATFPTPDGKNDLGYRGYLTGLNVAGSVVSFFNQADYALKTGREFGINVSWEGNQLMSKPNQNLSSRTYAYDSGPPSNPFPIGQRCFLRDVGLPFNERMLIDIHESMAFVARPRSEAAGASNVVSGKIGRLYNIGPDTPSNFRDGSADHGGQFSRRIQQTQEYYRELGVRLGVINLQQ